MEKGSSFGNQNTPFIFISDEKRKKKGLKGYAMKDSVMAVSLSGNEQPSWYCPKCKRMLITVIKN